MKPIAALPLLLLPLLLTACDVRVRNSDRRDRDADLDVRTPLGGLTVRNNDNATRVGLPIYTGATPLREHGHSNADVQIDTRFFALDVSAAKFASADAPDAVLAFYRAELGRYGFVTECKGDIDFVGRRDRVRCRERWGRSEVQLAVGSRGDHRIVSVKPRGDGSEFALVHVDTRGVPDPDF